MRTSYIVDVNLLTVNLVLLAQTNVSKTMFGRSNYTENRDMNISCKPIRNETAISVKWEQKATRYKPEFEVRYKRAGDDMNPFTVIETKYFNWTISPVVAGTTYTVQVTAKFPQNPVLIYIPVLAYCGVPEKSKWREFVATLVQQWAFRFT